MSWFRKPNTMYTIIENRVRSIKTNLHGGLFLRERPFNLKGRRGEGYGFFLKKYSDSQCCWKKYSDFGGGKKKKYDSEFL